MKSILISSPQMERKIASLASVALMVGAWLALGGFLVWAFRWGRPAGWHFEWCVVILGFLALLLIPFQLAGYFRQMRTGKLGDRGVVNFEALASCQPQSIKKGNYLFAFLVACLIPAVSVYIHSLIILWSGGNLHQVVIPLDAPEGCFACLCLGAISFLVLAPFLRYRLLRWCVALTLCAFWMAIGFLQTAKTK